jgi:methylated-DNA-[protein]-cysteine S-methyltransferase
MKIRWCSFETAYGLIRLAATEVGACRLSLPGEDAGAFFRWLALRFSRAMLVEDPGTLTAFILGVQEFLRGESKEIVVPLDPVGSPFQGAVWEEVRRIPFGVTITYGEIARRLGGLPRAARAVGAAVAANPLPILIPTHRVVGSDGSIRGYGPAVSLKEELLRLEGIVPRSRRRGAQPAPESAP